MAKVEIQFLVFEGCPLAAPARKNLETALAECGISGYEEIDILNPEVSEEMRGWGSPTILINGRDLSGIPKGNSVSCRVYPDADGVPSAERIATYVKACQQ